MSEQLVQLSKSVIRCLTSYYLQVLLLLSRANLLDKLVCLEEFDKNAVLVLDLLIIGILLPALQFIKHGYVTVPLKYFLFNGGFLICFTFDQVRVVIESFELRW